MRHKNSSDELSTQKRLARTNMELSRAQMALTLNEATAPIAAATKKLYKVRSHPLLTTLAIGGAAFLLFEFRFKQKYKPLPQPAKLRSKAGWILPNRHDLTWALKTWAAHHIKNFLYALFRRRSQRRERVVT
jgi:hypothetical protein